VPRAPRLLRLIVAVTAGWILAAPAEAREPDPHVPSPGALHEIPLPGGVQAAMDALGVPGVPDRAHFLPDTIRRQFQTLRRSDPPGERALTNLLAHLDAAATSGGAPTDTIPLPLPPRLWIDVILDGDATEETLAASILRSSHAALLYQGLLSLDDETRDWLEGRPAFVKALAVRSAALFATAAPGVRVRDGVIELPGGPTAAPVWEALVGRAADRPEEFLRALLAPGQGRLAYFVWAMSQLSASQVSHAMGLDEATPAGRVGAARRLLGVFERLGWDWRVEDRPFWRPALDPALLAAELASDADGRPVTPGTREFWHIVFADRGRARLQPVSDDDARAAVSGTPADFAWLCEQIFDGTAVSPESRYHLVLFASRLVPRLTPGTARDALDAVRAALAFPTLSSALERAGVTDVAVFAAAGRRAAEISRIRSRAVANRTLAQFQGTLALLTRAAARSAEPEDAIGAVVASLVAVETSPRGDYEGRLVRWLDTHLGALASRRSGTTETTLAAGGNAVDVPLDTRLRYAAAGAFTMPLSTVDWEGTRYRVDLAHAELVRIDQLLGRAARPYASAAAVLTGVADALETGLAPGALARHLTAVEDVGQDVGWEARSPGFLTALRRHAVSDDTRAATRLAPDLRLAADDLLARGLVELTYAVALGQPERIPISAAEAAARHGFGMGAGDGRRLAAWQPPVERQDPISGWQVSGSLLGLDVRLAPFSALQLSSTPPAQRPTLNDQDRRAIMETIPLVAPAALVDADRDAIVAAIHRGRARLAALGSPFDALVLAHEIRMSPAKQSLFAWALTHDPAAASRFLSTGDLLWLGIDPDLRPERLDAWGATARPRAGCLCLRVSPPGPEEILWGRWHVGLRISGFPDLNLRLAELLAELQMPAPLLGPVLAPAVFDFVNLVVSPDPDDRRGLVEFVQGLHLDQIEQYLAALTTDGPLVPMGEASEPSAADSGRGGGEAP
jgi:hypothetical protein